MSIEEIVRNLRYEQKKHENDRVDTFQTNISVMCKDCADCIEGLKARAEKAEAERDAAIKDMRPKDNCDICKHSREGIEDCVKYDWDCAKCNSDKCVCRDCRNENKWEWRGVGEDK